MSEEKRCIIDLREMGDRYGLEQVDVVKDGKVIMRDHAWNKEALQKAVAECKQRAAGAEVAELRGHVPNWALSAMAYAVQPAVCFFKIGPGGIYELTSTAFPIDAAKPTCGMFFEVDEEGDNVYVKAMTDNPHADAHGFDLTKFDQIIMPPIPSCKNVFLSGETVNPVAVSMVLTYADISRSVYIRFHQEPNYYCCVTNTPDVEIGDAVPAE
ncbi:MAG: hypothetical protein LUD79_07180 [Oscillospiraceae bacterium]|nr:hypothetical protein [Oscillospiraceae bacterium]